jgi:hypothetical protein
MGLCDIVDKFLNQHGLADTSTSEETNFTTTSVGSEEVDDLDTRLEDFGSGRLVDERRRFGVDGQHFDTLDGSTFINGLANDVHDTSKGILSNRDLNWGTRVDDFLSTDETFGTIHSNCPHGVLTQVGGDFKDETATVEVLDFEGVKDWGKVFSVELDVDNGTDDGLDGTYVALSLGGISAGYRKVIFPRFSGRFTKNPHQRFWALAAVSEKGAETRLQLQKGPW